MLKKLKKGQSIAYKNKQSGHVWLIEPYTAYKVTNIFTGNVYIESEEGVAHRLNSPNLVERSLKAIKTLYGATGE